MSPFKFDSLSAEIRVDVIKFFDRPMLVPLEAISFSLQALIKEHLAQVPYVVLYDIHFGYERRGTEDEVYIIVGTDLCRRLLSSTSKKPNVPDVLKISMAECEHYLSAPYLRAKFTGVEFKSFKIDDVFCDLMRFSHLWKGKSLQISLPKRKQWQPPFAYLAEICKEVKTAECLVRKMPFEKKLVQIWIDHLTIISPLSQYPMNDIIDWLFRPSEQIWHNKFIDPNERSLSLAQVQKGDKSFVEEFLEKLKEQFFSSRIPLTFSITLTFGRRPREEASDDQWRRDIWMPPCTIQNALGEQLQIGIFTFGGHLKIQTISHQKI